MYCTWACVAPSYGFINTTCHPLLVFILALRLLRLLKTSCMNKASDIRHLSAYHCTYKGGEGRRDEKGRRGWKGEERMERGGGGVENFFSRKPYNINIHGYQMSRGQLNIPTMRCAFKTLSNIPV